MKQKILFAIGCLASGGAERQMALLAGELASSGALVKVFCLEKGGELQDYLECRGVEVVCANYQSESKAVQKTVALLIAQLQLWWLSVTWRPNVLHAFLPLTNFMGSFAGRLAFVSCVVTSKRALGTHQDRHWGWRIFDLVSNRLSTAISVNSKAVLNDALIREGLDKSKVSVIYNGLQDDRILERNDVRVEMRDELDLSESDYAFVFVANLIPYKGHDDLVDAFSIVVDSIPNAKLFLIGDDRGIGEHITRKVHQYNLQSSVFLLGSRSDVNRLLLAMDCGLIASKEEGFSNALLEKLLAGLPVVATDVGGNSEALTGMPGCTLVSSGDVEGLAFEMIEMVGRGANCGEMSDQRRSIALRRYSVASMVAAYKELYTECGGASSDHGC